MRPGSNGTADRCPILVGRSEERLRAIAERHGLARWTTSLDEVLGDPDVDVYFDTQVTSAREPAIALAIAAGKHVYTEKPVAASAAAAFELADAAKAARVTHGVVQDKLFLPGMIKLRRLHPGTGVTVLDRLSLNQATVGRLEVPAAVELCARHEIPAIGLWREHVARTGLPAAAAKVRAAGLSVSSLCRGGFFTHADPAARRAAIADNKAAIAEAAALGADTLVLVSGGLVPGHRDIGLARRMIADAIAELVPSRRPTACGWASRRCTRCSPPTGA
jgi:hypothetical protein